MATTQIPPGNPVANAAANAALDNRAASIGYLLRSDLIAVEQSLGAQSIIAIKDPVSLNYFHFGQREWFLLEQLRQPITLAELQQRHARKYPQTTLNINELKFLLMRAFRDGLLIATGAMHVGQAIFLRQSGQAKSKRWTSIFQVLAIRFKGVDPELFLNWTAGLGRILFSSVTVLLLIVASICSLLMCMTQWESIESKLPTLNQFFSGENFIYILIAMAGVKILHELGHAMACKRFGGECHEIGFMLLAFMPCLYCNVSDTWMTAERWKRIAVSFGGIYIELILANIALFLWYFSHPGIFQMVSLNVVLICSLNTLLINGNPLLRYDGYYVLVDLISVPNLSQQSRAAFWYPVHCWLTATKFQWHKWRVGLALYALASTIYRVIVITTILWIVHTVTRQWGIELVGNIVSLIVLSGIVLPLVIRAVSMIRLQLTLWRQRDDQSKLLVTGSAGTMRWFRLAILICIVVLAIRLLWQLPLPHRVTAPLVVELADPEWIFVPIEGKLEQAVQPNSLVQPGEAIAKLSNSQLEFQLGELQNKIDNAKVRLEQLENRVNSEPDVVFKIPVVRAELESSQVQAQAVMSDIDRLTIRCSQAGVVFSRPEKIQKIDSQRYLPNWTGDPLAFENRGAWLEKGDWLCQIGHPDQQRLVMMVDQSQIEFVENGDRVRVRLDQVSDRIFDGTVQSIAKENTDLETETSSGQDRGSPPRRIDQIQYRVEVSFDLDGAILTPGSTGIGKVVSEDRTVGQYITRWFKQTLRFEY